MKKYFLNLVSYNAWANHKISEFIQAAGDERSLALQVSSFPTIRETAFHIWDAEGIWMSRLKGESIAFWPSKNFNGTTAEGCNLMVSGSRDFINFVELLPDGDLSKIIHYNNINGVAFQNTLEDIIAHVMNHSTFHRGQLVTMLRVAGFTSLKSTDLITFLREGNR